MVKIKKKTYDQSDYCINADYHTHTVFSHGKGTIEDNANMAKELKLQYIAITDHGLDHLVCGIEEKDIPEMRHIIDSYNSSNSDIRVLLGAEMNFKGVSGEIDFPKNYADMLDIVLCGFHVTAKPSKFSDVNKIFFPSLMPGVYKINKQFLKNSTDMYVRAIKKYPIDIIAHVNRKAKVNVLEVARIAEEYGSILEISSRHSDLTDDEYDDIFNRTNVNLVINSDAHNIDAIGKCDLAIQKLIEFQVNPNRILNVGENKLLLRSKNFKTVDNI